MLRRDFLKQIGILTGSVAFGVSGPDSDVDYLVRWDNLEPLGVDLGDEPQNDYGDFTTYRFEEINLIVSHHEDFHAKWMQAHEHCLKERPAEKARRIQVFRHYLYGEPIEGEPTYATAEARGRVPADLPPGLATDGVGTLVP
jgi:hypothetical protein